MDRRGSYHVPSAIARHRAWIVGNPDARKASAALVEQADDVAIGTTARPPRGPDACRLDDPGIRKFHRRARSDVAELWGSGFQVAVRIEVKVITAAQAHPRNRLIKDRSCALFNTRNLADAIFLPRHLCPRYADLSFGHHQPFIHKEG